MVSGITSNFSLNTLNYIQDELSYAKVDINGYLKEEETEKLSSDTNYVVKTFGKNRNIINQKITELIESQTKQPEETSKEAAPDMNLDLDTDDEESL